MTGINHKQAQRYLRAATDGLIRESQRALLDAHLRECDFCRAKADELNAFEAHLKKSFQARWDASDGPSRNVMTTIQSRSRRIIMTNRINTGLKMLAGIAALLVLGLIFSSVIQQFQKSSTNTSAPISTTQQAIGTDKPNGGLLAFVSEKSGNPEIYTMYADGSNLTNLTNDPAYDGKPFWSPNGKRIAFESDRSGLPQIYLMDANGSNVTQVTDDESAHLLPYNIAGSSDPWSPDGSKLLFLQQNPGDGTLTLCSININRENKISIITGKIQFNGISWSPDGKHIGFILNDSQSTDENDFVPEIYIANTDGSVPWVATEFLQQNEQFSDTGYTWSSNGQAIIFKTFLQKTNPQWAVYEVRLDDHSAIEKYSTESFSLIKWQDGVVVTSDSNGAFNWLNMDRISGVLDPYENCDIPFAGSYMNQSPGGNWAIAAYCPNGDHWFYWANSDGTEIKQLFDSPISAKEASFTDQIIWSPDDTFIVFVFNLASSVTNDMYILNLEKSLSNPTIRPLKIESGFSPSWQPQTKEESVIIKTTEEKPTPEPLTFSLTVQEAEALAGFDVFEPSYIPADYAFDGASYDSQFQRVAMRFISQPEGSDYSKVIYIYQQYGTFDLGPALHPDETPVPIGNVEGIFIRGAYVSESPDTTAYRWDAYADSYSLYWRIEDTAFSINFLGGETIPPIPLTELVTIAKSMK